MTSRVYLWRRHTDYSDTVMGGSLPAGFALTRSSTGHYVNNTGGLASAAIDVPRFTYDAVTHQLQGLLIEAASTNQIVNPMAEGAVPPSTNPTGWSTTSFPSQGMTLTILGTGSEDGINYIEYRMQGTPLASVLLRIPLNPSGASSALVTPNTPVTASAYLRAVTGDFTMFSNVRMRMNCYAGGTGVVNIFGGSFAHCSSAPLISQRMWAGGTTGPTIDHIRLDLEVGVVLGAPVDVTFRLGLPQLEMQQVATMPMRPPPGTPGVSARTGADILTITGYADGRYQVYIQGLAGTYNTIAVVSGGVWVFAWPALALAANETILQSIALRRME